ncbi:MAG: pyridoxal-dependent decarboxylase [Candidatus Electrothrix sp. Rat3]|nr:pyridoxal-dependent decarboxylase [Candidatus Electrothrix rattekaaiensis]
MHWEKFADSAAMNLYLEEKLVLNNRYSTDSIMGVPASVLDREIFPYSIAPDSIYWKLLRENPNHIGCHTLSGSEPFFRGTQEIEKELLQICAKEILGAEADDYDGYVSSGGTESNIQALWIFRNRYILENCVQEADQADPDALQHCFLRHIQDIDVICSEDTHYSVHKAANILNLHQTDIPVDERTRQIRLDILSDHIDQEQAGGKKFFIIVLNMGTTMFGSVDEVAPITDVLDAKQVDYVIHIDAAFGGFIYPFTCLENKLSFRNRKISSFTLDAHKMLQAPYGTGIFLIRRQADGRSLLDYVTTVKAGYVKGFDSTLCGSRSGANAVSIWMILKMYGADGGTAFCQDLLRRTELICSALESLGVEYFRNPFMNIVALRASEKIRPVAERHHLVPDSHDGAACWYKIVVMDHVSEEMIDAFLQDMKKTLVGQTCEQAAAKGGKV